MSKLINCLAVSTDKHGHNVAIIAATVNDDFGDGSSLPITAVLEGSVITAVTRWITLTYNPAAIALRHGHFNIADLAEHLASDALQRELRDQGIERLSVHIHSDETRNTWGFDDNLFDAAATALEG